MKTTYDRALCWIRRDLRLSDHTALKQACQRSKAVAVVFIFDTTILKPLDRDDRRVTFIHDSLTELDEQLSKQGSRLVVLKGDPVRVIPNLAKQFKAQAVFTNRDYEPSAKVRDQTVAKALDRAGVELLTFKDHVVFEGREILNKTQEPYKVFTPYSRQWIKTLQADPQTELDPRQPNLAHLAPVTELKPILQNESSWSLPALGFERIDLKKTSGVTAGEKAGRARLSEFSRKIENYANDRDFPALGATSGLSVHLRFGTISVREALRMAFGIRGEGAKIWINEIIWRDFYQMILDQFPHVAEGSFKRQYDRLRWPGDPAHFQAWCEGKTGFPLVDAAMRCLNATGFMHNRLRMIVASFLTKDLLIDWKEGERYFAKKLLDYDAAANLGGWQWASSVGTDAQPYFRIFNPESQSKKFDPKGVFIRQWCPELKNRNDRDIHKAADPIVDHSVSRTRALKLFKA